MSCLTCQHGSSEKKKTKNKCRRLSPLILRKLYIQEDIHTTHRVQLCLETDGAHFEHLIEQVNLFFVEIPQITK